MKLELTEDQQDAVILTTLKRDLQNVQDALAEHEKELAEDYSLEYSIMRVKCCKKDIKMLKRAINFYSVMDEY